MSKRLKDGIYRQLDVTGDGTGSKDANVNGVVTPVPFIIAPPAGETYLIARMLVHIEDNANFLASNYGGVSTLANGVSIKVEDSSGVIMDLCDGHDIQSLSHWGMMCYDLDYVEFGSGNNFANVRWTFEKGGEPLELKGDLGQKLVVTINDDLTALVEQHFFVHGRRV